MAGQADQKAEPRPRASQREPIPVIQSRASRTASIGSFSILILGVLYFARELLLPVVLAFLLALTFSPIVRVLERRKIPPGLTAGVIVLGLVGSALTGAYLLSDPVTRWLETAPRIGQEIERKFDEWRESVEKVSEASEQVEDATTVAGEPEVQEVVVKQPGLLARAATNLLSVVTTFGIMSVLLFFLLATSDLFYEKLVRVAPTLKDKKRALTIVFAVERQVSRYLFTITLINSCLGVAVGIAMWFAGMPSPALWGIVAAFLNFIPYLGALIGIAAVSAVSILTFDQPAQIVLPPLFYLACTALEGQFVTPMVLGRRLTMNPVVIFLAVALWTWLWGMVGALIAVPILIVIKVLCDNMEALHGLGEFLASRNAPANGQEQSEATSERS